MSRPLEIGADGYDAEAREQQEQSVLRMMSEERIRREARRRLDAEERGPIAWPEILTLQERLARPRTQVDDRIVNWLPAQGRVVLSAQYKAGKTTLIGNCVRSLVDGDPFLDQYVVQKICGTAVILDTEMSPHTLDEWLDAQRIQNSERVIPIPLRGRVGCFNILDREIRGQWADRLRRLKATVLMLDCLRPILDALGLDEHRDAGRFLVALDELLRAADISESILVQHMGHLGERARGDSRLRDWPDAEWRLVREDDDPTSARFISVFGRDVYVPESALRFDAVSRRLTLDEGSRQDKRAEDALQAVLDTLGASASALTVRAIQAALADSGHARDRIRDAIKLGVRNGSISTEPGQRRAILHRACDCAGACGDRAAHSEA